MEFTSANNVLRRAIREISEKYVHSKRFGHSVVLEMYVLVIHLYKKNVMKHVAIVQFGSVCVM